MLCQGPPNIGKGQGQNLNPQRSNPEKGNGGQDHGLKISQGAEENNISHNHFQGLNPERDGGLGGLDQDQGPEEL